MSDPGALVSAYAGLFQSLGGSILSGDAETLRQTTSGWSVDTAEGRVDASSVVIALGPWSPDLLRKYGYRIPLVRKRGYHMHYQGGCFARSTADRYGKRLRHGANGQGDPHHHRCGADGPRCAATPIQLARAEASARELLDLGTRVEPEPWYGTRPCTPDMLPVLGPAASYRGLWMNFGHGHQGVTLGPATGRLLAELMSGETPSIDASPYDPRRFQQRLSPW